MSEANRVSFAYLQEVTFGTTPASALTEFLRASDSFGQNPTTRISTTLRSDRQVQDHIRENIAPAGDVAFNFSFAAADDFIGGLLGSTWSGYLALTGVIIAVATGNKFTSDTSAGGVSLATVTVGSWIKMGGFVTHPVNNGYFKVISYNLVATTHTIVVAGATLINETGVANTVHGSHIFNGVTPISFSLEKAFLDLSNIFDSFTGMRVGSMDLNIKNAQAIGGTFNFQGKSAGATGSASIGTGANIAAPLNQELNANDHVATVYQNNAATTLKMTDMTLKASNNLRQKGEIGLLGPFDIGVGRFSAEGTIATYFEDRTFLDLARAYSLVGFAFRIHDDAGNTYILDLPNVRVSGGDPQVTGVDTDVVNTVNFGANIDPVSGFMMGVARFRSTD